MGILSDTADEIAAITKTLEDVSKHLEEHVSTLAQQAEEVEQLKAENRKLKCKITKAGL